MDEEERKSILFTFFQCQTCRTKLRRHVCQKDEIVVKPLKIKEIPVSEATKEKTVTTSSEELAECPNCMESILLK